MASPIVSASVPLPPLRRTSGPVRVREIGPTEQGAFEAFVAAHPAGSLLQSWAWGELRARQSWQAIRLLARDGAGHPCGAASVLCRELPIGGSILYLPRGPVLDFRDDRVLDAMVAALYRCGQRQRAVLCKIDPYLTPPDPMVARALAARGFVVGHRRGHFEGMQPRLNVIVPLRGEPDEVLGRFHAKTRYNIRLAAKRGVTVRRGDRADLPVFHRLLMTTCARNGFAERQLPYFLQVWDALAPARHIEVYVAECAGEALAAAILFTFGAKAVYAYGASADVRRELMAPYAVQWTMIRRALELHCTSYDMTGVPRHPQEGEPASGLYRFKRGFWPEISEFLGERDLPLQPSLYRLWRVIEPAYWGGQVWLKRTLRRLGSGGDGSRAAGEAGPAPEGGST